MKKFISIALIAGVSSLFAEEQKKEEAYLPEGKTVTLRVNSKPPIDRTTLTPIPATSDKPKSDGKVKKYSVKYKTLYENTVGNKDKKLTAKSSKEKSKTVIEYEVDTEYGKVIVPVAVDTSTPETEQTSSTATYRIIERVVEEE